MWDDFVFFGHSMPAVNQGQQASVLSKSEPCLSEMNLEVGGGHKQAASSFPVKH